MNERHEVKHSINLVDYFVLRQRLRAVLYPDVHAGTDGTYHIRSLYFDNAENKALREKLDGIKNRDKYRIRYYNDDTGFIHLEKKSKRGNLCVKQSALMKAEQIQALLEGDVGWMKASGDSLVRELFYKMQQDGLRPVTIVDYERDPFTYPAGNVRVTLDHHLRTSLYCSEFLSPDCVTIPAGEDIILEVKWDAYLPDIVRDVVQLQNRRAAAFSKYAACRIYTY